MEEAPVITGARLTLRPFVREDIDAEYLAWLNHPERMRFSGQRHHRHDAASSAAYVQSFAGTAHYFWAVEERATGKLAGTMTAYAEGEATDVGILIGRPGQGLGSEAWGLALDHLLRAEQRAKVTGGSLAAHAAMRRIFERWGMVLETQWSEARADEGPGVDIVRYSITREVWLARAAGGFSG
jgi:RimJ/RimL family protein N-acetyltransferase